MSRAGDAEKVGANIGEMLVQGGHVDTLAGDAQPDAALREIEGQAEAENEDHGSRPDEGGAAVSGNEQDSSFGGVIESDGPLFVKTGGGLADADISQSFEIGRRGSRHANTDKEGWVTHLSELDGGRMREGDGEGHGSTGDGNALRIVNLQALVVAGLVEDDRLGADEAAVGVTDGERDGGYEGRLVEDDAIIGKRIVDAQVIAMGDKLAVTEDAQVGDVVGSEAATRVEGGGEFVDAKADIVGRAARVDDGALPGRQGLVKGETGQAVAESDEGRGQDMTRGAVLREAMPLRKDASHEQGDEGGVKDEGGKGGPGIFVGIKICDGLVVVGHNGTHAIAPLAQFGGNEGERVRMAARSAFERVLIELLAAPDDGMFEVLPDGGRAVERADNDAHRENGEQQQEVPARENGKELQRVEDGRERAVARHGVLLNPGGIAGRVIQHFAGSLDKIDTQQANDGNGGNEQDGGTHRAKPSPRRIHRVTQSVSQTLAEAMARYIVFGRA